jgi:aerobic-type carbon monoxide dehydrogenase small subunit (CoxS/CutS family)
MDLSVNGKTYQVEAEPDRTLLWVLRDELGLTGTKFGCGVGICGSCTVHIDGQAVRSCLTPLSAAAGKQLLTLEGLAVENADGTLALHPVQEAFIELQVHQCGYCMSGQMMTAIALLEQNPSPSDAEIIEAMDRNLCRCGAYPRIRQAVARAAEIAAGG